MIANNLWDEVLKDEFKKEYFINLQKFIDEEYKNHVIFPKYDDIYNALKYTSYENVKVVIVGQDPYHEKNQAHGLCFSVQKGVPIPPSLKNIFKEMTNDLQIPIPKNGDLTKWASQGVLLLNTVWTVREHLANSHKNKGWEIFTKKIIEELNKKEHSIVFVLWGNDAKKMKKYISNPNHFVLESSHPSPLSCYNGFLGCKHFSKINEILKNTKQKEIDWNLEE